jgi:hypothetical protein
MTGGTGSGLPGSNGAMPAGVVVVIRSWGGLAPSREESDTAVLLVVEMPKLIRPFPVTAGVTLTLVHDPAVMAPELPS